MSHRELEDLLEELQQELNEGSSLDEDARNQLADLQVRIGQLLGNDPDTPDTHLSASLTRNIERFESSHPALTMVLGRIADILNKLGI